MDENQSTEADQLRELIDAAHTTLLSGRMPLAIRIKVERALNAKQFERMRQWTEANIVRPLSEHLEQPIPVIVEHPGVQFEIVEHPAALDVDAGHKARALHRITRAMHDGHCPKCGHLGPSERFYDETRGHVCPKRGCGFIVTHEESRKALDAFRPFLAKSFDIWEQWKNEPGDVEEDSGAA